MQRNEAQQQAIKHKDGPMMVLAGPGSGKTTVITNRTKYLIEQHKVPAKNILVITFTKAAAVEMKERFLRLVKQEHTQVTFGTFHSVFFQILKYAYRYETSNVISEKDKKQFLLEILHELELEIEDEAEFLSDIESEISFVKGELLDPMHYYSMTCSEDNFRTFYNGYERRLRTAGYIDFDDMLVFTYELFKEREDILKLWQERYQYILIDEFQDINRIQYEIVKMLARSRKNIFIVGDDDQSIYRFRGAKPEIMLGFEKDYPGTKRILLDINYRSTLKIIEASERVIGNNEKRFSKKIITYNEEGEQPVLRTFKLLHEQNKEVVEQIQEYRNKGVPLSEIAILFRTNTQPRALLEKLMEYNISFRMRDAIPNIYEHWIAKNIISYIKIALGSTERALYLQIINRPNRYVSRDNFKETDVNLHALIAAYSDKEWMCERLYKFEYDLKLLKTMNPYSAINYIRKGIGYDEFIKEYAQYRKMNDEELYDTLDELQEAAKPFPSYEAWFAHMDEYGEELKEQAKIQRDYSKDAITMATMHACKGLEYEVVFIVDANEGIMPHHKAVLDADIEEERRLFYVAMTRAKRSLHIYSVKERYNKKLEISRFVAEQQLDVRSIVPGSYVFHKTYGKGKVIEKKDGTLTVFFEKQKAERKLDLLFCMNNQILKQL